MEIDIGSSVVSGDRLDILFVRSMDDSDTLDPIIGALIRAEENQGDVGRSFLCEVVECREEELLIGPTTRARYLVGAEHDSGLTGESKAGSLDRWVSWMESASVHAVGNHPLVDDRRR